MPEAVIALPSLPKLYDEYDDKWQSLTRGSAAEFFATLIFVFVGTGAVVACQAELGHSQIGVPSQTLISFAHGFAIMVLVYSIGEISGGHINPAVTWACLFTGKISVVRAVVYVLSQIFGGIIGSSFLKSLLPPGTRYGMGCHSVNPDLTPAQGFGAEVMFTFIFIFVVFSTAISPFAGKFSPLSGGESGKQYGPGKLTPFAVGMTILILHLVGIPLTGASMNPARTFGPAVVNNCWKNMWVYWLGPLIGSTVAAIVAQAVFLSTPRDIFRLNKTGSAKDYSASVVPKDKEPEQKLTHRTPPVKRVTRPTSGPTATSTGVTVDLTTPSAVSSSPRQVPQQSKPISVQDVVSTEEPKHDMHKSSSGQFSAIMQEDSVVELDEFN